MATETTQTTSPPELATMRIEIEGDIGTLTLDRPDALNAMSPEMIGEMTIAFAWLADRAPLRGLIVTGEGRAFSSGGDVTWFRKGVEEEGFDLPSDVRRGAEVLHQAIVDFQRIPYPVIAAINGPAAGAGFSLALNCDIRIASDEAVLVCAYGRIGASPDGGMTYFLPRIVGPARAKRILLEDPTMSAEQALEEGLVDYVVPAGELMRGGDREGGEARQARAALRANGEAARQHEPRQHADRAPPARAPRDRRLDGDRGPAQRGPGVLRRREAGVHRALAGPGVSPLAERGRRPRRRSTASRCPRPRA